MKPKREPAASPDHHDVFYAFEVIVPRFEYYWHYHPEYELTFIESGTGLRCVGNSRMPFNAGDLVLLGPNLTHTWIGSSSDGPCRAYVLHIQESNIQNLLNMRAFSELRPLLTAAHKGVHFPNVHAEVVKAAFCDLTRQSGIALFAAALQLLDRLKNESRLVLSSAPLGVPHSEIQFRIDAVMEYVQTNFFKKLSLTEASKRVHLTESGFCKFFKKTTGQTFSDYVNEVRIANACLLLLQTDMPIGWIAVESGFENLAYFNRVFLKKNGLNPSVWRKKHRTA